MESVNFLTFCALDSLIHWKWENNLTLAGTSDVTLLIGREVNMVDILSTHIKMLTFVHFPLLFSFQQIS